MNEVHALSIYVLAFWGAWIVVPSVIHACTGSTHSRQGQCINNTHARPRWYEQENIVATLVHAGARIVHTFLHAGE